MQYLFEKTWNKYRLSAGYTFYVRRANQYEAIVGIDIHDGRKILYQFAYDVLGNSFKMTIDYSKISGLPLRYEQQRPTDFDEVWNSLEFRVLFRENVNDFTIVFDATTNYNDLKLFVRDILNGLLSV